ncbi:MAG: tRNA (adenosine(37)-N6)-threonylcarbamoyltransferase complex dimerization subunit type 1 TsaB [Gammaproteobacteria bacterium]
MSVVLAVDAGGALFSAALRINEKTRQCFAPAAPHSAHALPLIKTLLAEAEISLAQCDVFAFGAGPGRFSGLRLACGIAQAFAFAAGRPGAAVNSLAALAEANYGDTAACAEAVIPAHRGYIYTARCRRAARWISARPRLLAAEEYAPVWRRVCGKGAAQYPQILQRNANAVFCNAAPEPDAAATAKIAATMLAEGDVCAAPDCRPLYVRRRVAQTTAERAKNSAQK